MTPNGHPLQTNTKGINAMKLLALLILSFAGCGGSSGGGSAPAPVPPVVVPPNTKWTETNFFSTVQYSWHRHEGVFRYAGSGQAGSHEFVHESNPHTGYLKNQMFLSVKIWHESYERVELFLDPTTPNVWKGSDARGFSFEYSPASNPAHGYPTAGQLKASRAPNDYYDSHTKWYSNNG